MPVKKEVPEPPRELHSAAVHDPDNVCRDEDCPILYLHAAHPPRKRRGPKSKMRSI